MIPPLLHVAQTASGLTTVDRSVVAAAGLAMAAAALVIWRPRHWHRFDPRRSPEARGRFFAAIGVGLMLAALVQLVAPLDHIALPPPRTEASTELHYAHCHGAPATCAGVPGASGTPTLLAARPIVIVPSLFAVLLIASVVTLNGRTIRPEVPPPLAPARALSI